MIEGDDEANDQNEEVFKRYDQRRYFGGIGKWIGIVLLKTEPFIQLVKSSLDILLILFKLT